MKMIFTLMAVFTLALTAMAQKGELKVDGKGTDQLVISIENDFNLGAFGFKLYLPDGTDLLYSEDDEDYVYEKNSARLVKKVGVNITKTPDGKGYSFLVGAAGTQVKNNSGEVLTLTLKNPIDGTATIKGISFTNLGENLDKAENVFMDNNENTTINIELKATAINGISADATKSGAIFNMAGQRVSKATKGIYVVDGKKVVVK
jgi:hypothetical protein